MYAFWKRRRGAKQTPWKRIKLKRDEKENSTYGKRSRQTNKMISKEDDDGKKIIPRNR